MTDAYSFESGGIQYVYLGDAEDIIRMGMGFFMCSKCKSYELIVDQESLDLVKINIKNFRERIPNFKYKTLEWPEVKPVFDELERLNEEVISEELNKEVSRLVQVLQSSN